ncbi:MAG: site-specific DNA-methyltransferase, partial [Caldisericia bacterium]|nr:site-specific DNA-methyltransferase [Caldisericia bacterium]
SIDVLTKKWQDWIDYWSVDFDYKRRKDDAGDFIFENEWQSFRTRKDRSLEFDTSFVKFAEGEKSRMVAVKVVDIFGNDTMTSFTLRRPADG